MIRWLVQRVNPRGGRNLVAGSTNKSHGSWKPQMKQWLDSAGCAEHAELAWAVLACTHLAIAWTIRKQNGYNFLSQNDKEYSVNVVEGGANREKGIRGGEV